MIKNRILKDDGRYLIYYSFAREPASTEAECQATPQNAESGVRDVVGDAMEPDTSAMGCNCNTPAGKDV